MSVLLGLGVLAALSAAAFWQKSAILFYLAAGLALITGLSWYPSYQNNEGLTVSLILIVFSFVCSMGAFRCLFLTEDTEESEE